LQDKVNLAPENRAIVANITPGKYAGSTKIFLFEFDTLFIFGTVSAPKRKNFEKKF